MPVRQIEEIEHLRIDRRRICLVVVLVVKDACGG